MQIYEAGNSHEFLNLLRTSCGNFGAHFTNVFFQRYSNSKEKSFSANSVLVITLKQILHRYSQNIM